MEEGGSLMQDTALEGQASGYPRTCGAEEECAQLLCPFVCPATAPKRLHWV